jgi:hypothetical protein
MSRFAGLKADIEREWKNLERLVLTMDDLLKKASSEATEIEIRAAGSLVHDFYTGLEKVFERIALKIDGDLPAGADWHVQLLQWMATPLEGIRPAVISDEEAERLEEYLRFRHLFRNIYGFELKWERIKPLAQGLEGLFRSLKAQIAKFKGFLDSLE